MKKIPTIFNRDWEGDRSLVTEEINPQAKWVFDGEGLPYQKLDGTCCKIQAGKFFKRREVKKGKEDPAGFILEQHDEITGKRIGWVEVGESKEDKYHREALFASQHRTLMCNNDNIRDATYELIGPKVQGNPENKESHEIIPHDALRLLIPNEPPLEFTSLKAWLSNKDIEGIVWHHEDGRMAKIKLRDFGLKRKKDKEV